MSSPKRFFYAVLIPEGMARTCLDAIRLIARPLTRFPAHITLRGPYERPVENTEFAAMNEKVRGKNVRVADVGMFTSPSAVAFLHCSCPDFLSVWDKSGFGYNPHVTLYEGSEKEFAESVAETVERYPIRFSFKATGLELLVSDKSSNTLAAREQYDPKAIADLLGESPSLEEIDALKPEERLEWIDRIARRLGEAHRIIVSA